MRVWTKWDTRLFAIRMVRFCIKHGLAFANFDNYGRDRASFRIDIRATAPIPSNLQHKLMRRQSWGVLKVETDIWDEPDDVKIGHNIGSILALRFVEFRELHKFPDDTRSITFLVALLFEKWWGRMFIPYWQKGFDRAMFKDAVEHITVAIHEEWNPTLIERTVHNFLNNLGIGEGPSWAGDEGTIWNTLMKWWWLAQLERGH